MVFSSVLTAAALDLGPLHRHCRVPFAEILGALVERGFEPRASRACLAELAARPGVAEYLDPDGAVRGDHIATARLLEPALGPWALVCRTPGERAVGVELDDDALADAAAVLRAGDTAGLLADLFGVACPPPARVWPAARAPGIYRREHASLLIRSREVTILVDPIAGARALFPSLAAAPAAPSDETVDAVALTHMHPDHYHLPSILAATRGPEVPVFVPAVPRPSLLCPESAAASLAAVGQTTRVLEWGRAVTLGDLTLEALPFHGEQPTAVAAGVPPGMRNWGNCYRVDTPDFSALVLADAGDDPDGSIVDAVRASAERRGPVDVVLCCGRSFASPFFGGLEHYFAALPFARLAELHARRDALPPTTAGPRGIAAVCAAAGARFYLPYAHGFAGPGRAIRDVGWGAGEGSEARVGRAVAAALVGDTTRVIDWRPGDVAGFTEGALRLEGERS